MSTSAGDDELPEGWASRVDPRFNRRFYYHRATKTSTWERPLAASEAKANATSAANTAAPQKASPHSPTRRTPTSSPASSTASPPTATRERPAAKREGDTRRRQWSMKYNPVTDDDGAAAAGTSAEKDDGEWVRVFSTTHQRHYFYHKQSGKTSWLEPRLSLQEVDSTDISTQADNDDDEDNSPTPASAQELMARPLFQPVSESVAARAVVAPSSAPHDDNAAAAAGASAEDFQRRVMDQFPALRRAFEELEEGQRRLQREREEHEAKVRAELEQINAKLAELRAAAAGGAVPPVPPSDAPIPRVRRVDSKLDVTLNRFSKDLQRRSLSVVERRSKLVSATMADREALKRVQETANRLSRERDGKAPTKETATAEAAATMKEDASDGGEEGLAAEMKGVEQGIDYAVREAKAQDAARAEARQGASVQHVQEGDVVAEDDEDGGYFRALGVRSDVGEAELKKAFRRKMIAWHPDKVKDAAKKQDAEAMSHLVQTAFRVLSDPWEREIYTWFGLEQYLLHVKVIQCFISFLLAGVDLIKHPKGFGWPRKRVLWLTSDLREIKTFKRRVTDDDKNAAALSDKAKGVKVASITEVRRGRSTEGLKRTGKDSRADRYFSIVSKDRVLDLEASSAEMAEFFATRLTLMIIDLKRDQQWMKRHYGEE